MSNEKEPEKEEHAQMLKSLFQHFEDMDRKIIADNPNVSPEIIERHAKLKKANEAAAGYEKLSSLGELARSDALAFVSDGLYRIKHLAYLSWQPNTSSSKKRDWEIISNHFHCNQKLDESVEDHIRTTLEDYYNREKLRTKALPEELQGVYDRLFQPEKEKQPEKAATENILQKVNRVLGSLPRTYKAGIVFTLTWTAYVVYRTTGYHELLGESLGQWNESDFLTNWIVVPAVVGVLVIGAKWVLSGRKD